MHVLTCFYHFAGKPLRVVFLQFSKHTQTTTVESVGRFSAVCPRPFLIYKKLPAVLFCFRERKYFEYLCINNGQVDTQSHQFRSSLYNYLNICNVVLLGIGCC